jgi:uncharacterized OB-fold protein
VPHDGQQAEPKTPLAEARTEEQPVSAKTSNEPLVSPHIEYDTRVKEGQLPFQRCSTCRSAVHPPRLACPTCGSQELSWATSAGTGQVYSSTSLSPREGAPYNVTLIDLDEGFRLMSSVEDREHVEIGSRVRYSAERSREAGIPLFVSDVQ